MTSGIIIPPPSIKAVLHKTAQFVAKNGKAFEGRILNSAEGKTAKFGFMQTNNPYYAYYEERIKFFELGGDLAKEEEDLKAAEEAALASSKPNPSLLPAAITPSLKTTSVPSASSSSSSSSLTSIASAIDPIKKCLLAKRELLLKAREADAKAAASGKLTSDNDNEMFYDSNNTSTSTSTSSDVPQEQQLTLSDLIPPSLSFSSIFPPQSASSIELDCMNLSAQFIACCGRHFLPQLIRKEGSNPLFSFLKPTNMFYTYFSALVDCYTKILKPSQADFDTFDNCSHVLGVLDAVAMRSEYKRDIMRMKALENSGSSDGLSLLSGAGPGSFVDWHDFTIVETIDFTDRDVKAAIQKNNYLQGGGCE